MTVQFRDILQAVSYMTGIPSSEITGQRQFKNYVAARRLIYVYCRKLTAISYPGIGRMMGGRDHSTVYFGLETFNAMVDKMQDWEEIDKCFYRVLEHVLQIRQERVIQSQRFMANKKESPIAPNH